MLWNVVKRPTSLQTILQAKLKEKNMLIYALKKYFSMSGALCGPDFSPIESYWLNSFKI